MKTNKTQKQTQRFADRRILDACKTFNEIQTGPNPLTPAEIRRLIDERGGIWHLFEVWAEPRTP
jgi:hypothetical protein